MYKILIDYYSEGFKFDSAEFDTVDEAVHEASKNTPYPFLIVKVINWKAEAIND